ncbi:unnamed protein product [Triticum turgidum subsp. durum]|uniref:Uncharacterized protein n=1 Tax=Triticum turgidum subsp. durum TaxID=4567 RepID=A0A9R0ZD96_TRITD|nr:unnamed protein product [Triticum turgidum subsp. durum]
MGDGGDATKPADTAEGAGGTRRGGWDRWRGGGIGSPAAALSATGGQGDAPAAPGAAAHGAALPQRRHDRRRPPRPGGKPRVRQRVGDHEGPRCVEGSGSELDYVPFGSGRRICAGIAMAERMTAYSVAMLLQAFDWELPEGAALDLTEKFGIVMKKATPLVAVPTPRLSRPELYSA